LPIQTGNIRLKKLEAIKLKPLRDEFMLKFFPKEKWLYFLDKGEFDIFPETK
jgi:hypothetical protein